MAMVPETNGTGNIPNDDEAIIAVLVGLGFSVHIAKAASA